MTPDEERRSTALDKLLHIYLSNDGESVCRELTVRTAPDNSAHVTFTSAPTQSEIGTLIKYLELMKSISPAQHGRMTIDVLNKALGEAGLLPIAEKVS